LKNTLQGKYQFKKIVARTVTGKSSFYRDLKPKRLRNTALKDQLLNLLKGVFVSFHKTVEKNRNIENTYVIQYDNTDKEAFIIKS